MFPKPTSRSWQLESSFRSFLDKYNATPGRFRQASSLFYDMPLIDSLGTGHQRLVECANRWRWISSSEMIQAGRMQSIFRIFMSICLSSRFAMRRFYDMPGSQRACTKRALIQAWIIPHLVSRL